MGEIVGLEGTKVRLVPIQLEKHLDNYVRWFNDPETMEYLGVEFPNSRGQEVAFFEQVEKSSSDVLFAIETVGGIHLGSSHIFGINFQHGFAKTGSFIGDLSERGQGYGTEASILRCRYAFHVLGLRILYSAYLGDNQQSAKMQAKVGYEVVGVNPAKFWNRGEYVSETLTAISRDQFFALHGNRLK